MTKISEEFEIYSEGYHGNHAAVTLRIKILKNVHPGGVPKGCPIPLVYESA